MKTEIPSEAILRNLLLGCGIPIETWGIGKAKPVSELLDEINERECHLRIDHNGLTRVVEIVKMHIRDREHLERGLLLMLRQVLPGDIVRERTEKNNRPSEKIKSGEAVEAALARGLLEELELSGSDWKMMDSKVDEESNLSPTLPGLPTVYLINHCNVLLNPGCHALRDEFTIETGNPKEGILHFAWEHPRQRKDFFA